MNEPFTGLIAYPITPLTIADAPNLAAIAQLMAEADAVAVLQGEGGLLVGEAELLGLGPHLDDVGRRRSRANQGDGPVHVLASPLIGVVLCRARGADGEGAVVAGAVALVAVQNIEERRVARTDKAVREDVRMRRAALPRDGIDALHILGPQIIQNLGDEAHGLVLSNAGLEELVELLVSRIDHRGHLGEQGDLVAGLHLAGLEEDLLAVDDADALIL